MYLLYAYNKVKWKSKQSNPLETEYDKAIYTLSYTKKKKIVLLL